MDDLHIESVAKKRGPGVYLRPWEYDVEPDYINQTGSQFFVLKDLTKYLRTDRLTGAVIPELAKSVLVMAYNPKTKDSDLILIDNIKGTTMVCDKQSSYEGLCFYIDMLRAKYRIS